MVHGLFPGPSIHAVFLFIGRRGGQAAGEDLPADGRRPMEKGRREESAVASCARGST